MVVGTVALPWAGSIDGDGGGGVSFLAASSRRSLVALGDKEPALDKELPLDKELSRDPN